MQPTQDSPSPTGHNSTSTSTSSNSSDDNDDGAPNNQSPVANSGSPRRKKPPLDLDAALYLQSTASYVQEPNSRSSPLSKGSSSSLRLGGCPQQQASAAQAFNYSGQNLRGQTLGYYEPNINNYNYNYSHRSNISVDYIDCLSNNDLAQQHQSSTANNMRAIPHCRKHLRLHRHRVEPSLNNNNNNTTNNNARRDDTANQRSQPNDPANWSAREPATGDARSQVSSSSLAADGSSQTADAAAAAAADTDANANANPKPNRAGASSTTSVLYPISVSEVKKRTYFIGSLAQDSLLGHDELFRYFPKGRVSIFVCTWNQNRKRSPMNLNELLLPEQLVYLPDIYAIGIQEAFSSQNEHLRGWEIELQTTLGPNHVLLHSCSLGSLHLSLFVRRDLIWFCSAPEESVYNSRSMPTNMIKTKGAVSIAFRFFGTSFMFTNCHFPAHENKLKDRVDEYQRIISSIDLPKNLKLLKPRYLSNDSTARFDCVFFMGDLNFRLEQRTFDETIHILEDIFQQKEPTYEALTQNDELLKVMEANQAFHGFDESQIKFPPTYKFLAQTNKYDRQTKRVPSYTDRILFRSKRQRHIQCLIYDWLPQLLSSDHKPVYCLFDVLIRPGHQQNMVSSLNAGLFQRTVYLEALKRRAENPESMRENGAAGSLICTIS